MPTVFEETVQALDFDPDAVPELDLELPEHLYPHTVDSFINYLGGRDDQAVDPQGGGRAVRGVGFDSAPVDPDGQVDGDQDTGGSATIE